MTSASSEFPDLRLQYLSNTLVSSPREESIVLPLPKFHLQGIRSERGDPSKSLGKIVMVSALDARMAWRDASI
jgi:hypothetical protein